MEFSKSMTKINLVKAFAGESQDMHEKTTFMLLKLCLSLLPTRRGRTQRFFMIY